MEPWPNEPSNLFPFWYHGNLFHNSFDKDCMLTVRRARCEMSGSDGQLNMDGCEPWWQERLETLSLAPAQDAGIARQQFQAPDRIRIASNDHFVLAKKSITNQWFTHLFCVFLEQPRLVEFDCDVCIGGPHYFPQTLILYPRSSAACTPGGVVDWTHWISILQKSTAHHFWMSFEMTLSKRQCKIWCWKCWCRPQSNTTTWCGHGWYWRNLTSQGSPQLNSTK